MLLAEPRLSFPLLSASTIAAHVVHVVPLGTGMGEVGFLPYDILHFPVFSSFYFLSTASRVQACPVGLDLAGGSEAG